MLMIADADDGADDNGDTMRVIILMVLMFADADER
mgnify:CR=1 FL=1